MRNRNVLRSLIAGALIGFAEAAPMDPVRLQRPLGVVWLDDRDLPDPMDGVPLMVLDPMPLGRSADTRRRVGRVLRMTLARPIHLLQRLRDQISAD